MMVTFIIPAYNEAETVGNVVLAAVSTGLGKVIVVSDGSQDETPARARDAGAEVITLEVNRGKGAAVAAALPRVESEIVVLLDADLVGLRAEHVQRLVEPVLAGESEMTIGVFSGGRLSTDLAHRLTPNLSGQRAIRRDLLNDLDELPRDYGIDLALSRRARAKGARVVHVRLEGITQVMKEEKYGLLGGLRRRSRMYAQVLCYLARSFFRGPTTRGG